ncbi:MAG: hypothetical protein ACD_19C00428G0006 [uncultured bacterium]|nr:MAG: hypothetical protein ACD_19C00428G0006 [uncultured bacterium]
MVKKYKNKQSLLLRSKDLLSVLAITGILLSVGLVNFSQVSDSKVANTQSVLSESDENKVEENKTEEIKKEQRKEMKRKENEEKKQEKIEVKKEVRLTTGKIKIDNQEDGNEVEDLDDAEDIDDDIDEVEDEIEGETELESEFESESETTSSDGTVNKFKLKLKTRTVNGKTLIETAAGEIETENSPDEAVSNLLDDGILDTPTSFEAKTNNDNKVEFEVQGVEIKKLLGLFEVNLPKTVTIDSETGVVTNTNQNIWTRFLSLLSI